MRIVSAVPSLSELLIDLGLRDVLVGITKFCAHPFKQPNYPHALPKRIGGTKNLHIEAIRALKPDLLIANKEENVKEQVEAIGQFCRVHLTEISTYQEAIKAIHEIGSLTNRSAASTQLCEKIELQGQLLSQQTASLGKRIRVAYLIWQNPLMTIGADTFIHSMLQLSGFDNVFSHQKRYPTISHAELAAAKPEVIFLSSEPYPFREKHILAFARLHPSVRICLIDGEACSWYGSRLLQSLPYLCKQRLVVSS